MNKFLLLLSVVCMSLAPSAALAYPTATCALNADKSSVIVVGSNPSAVSYRCMASCRANVTGQRAIERVECKFNLGKNAAEKTLCEKKGGSAGFFSQISPTKFVCEPR